MLRATLGLQWATWRHHGCPLIPVVPNVTRSKKKTNMEGNSGAQISVFEIQGDSRCPVFVDTINKGDDSLFMECPSPPSVVWNVAKLGTQREASRGDPGRQEGRKAHFILQMQMNVPSLLCGGSVSPSRWRGQWSPRPQGPSALQVLSTLTTPRACRRKTTTCGQACSTLTSGMWARTRGPTSTTATV